MSFFLPYEPERKTLRSRRTPAASPNVFLPRTPRISAEETLAMRGQIPQDELLRYDQIVATAEQGIDPNEQREAIGLMGAVGGAVEFAMPALEGSSFIDASLGVFGVEGDPAKSFKQQFTGEDDHALKRVGAEVVDGIFSPLTLTEVGLAVFSGGTLAPAAAASFLARTVGKMSVKGALKKLFVEAPQQIPESTVAPRRVIKTPRTRVGDDKLGLSDEKLRDAFGRKIPTEDILEEVSEPIFAIKIPKQTLKQITRVAKVMSDVNVPKNIQDRGKFAVGSYIMTRNGTIDAGAVSAMQVGEKFDATPEAMIGLGLLGGLFGYAGVGMTARKIPKVAQPESEIDLLDAINNSVAKTQYPEGYAAVEGVSVQKRGRVKRRPIKVATPEEGGVGLTFRTVEDLDAENAIQLTKTNAPKDQIMIDPDAPYEPFIHGKNKAAYWEDPEVKKNLGPNYTKARQIGGRPYAKAVVDVRINPERMQAEWSALPQSRLREADKDALDLIKTPEKAYFSGNTDAEKYKEFVEFRKLVELIDNDPYLFAVDPKRLETMSGAKSEYKAVWEHFMDRGKQYTLDNELIAMDSAVSLAREGRKRTANLRLKDIVGARGWRNLFGDWESLLTRTYGKQKNVSDMQTERANAAIKTMERFFVLERRQVNTQLDENSAEEWVYSLRRSKTNIDTGRRNVEINALDFLRNPQKFRRNLTELRGESVSAGEFIKLEEAAAEISTASRNIGSLIEQAGGGISKIIDKPRAAQWDESRNLNFIPEILNELPSDLRGNKIPMGNDGSRFISQPKDELRPVDPDNLEFNDIWPLKTGRIAYFDEKPTVFRNADGTEDFNIVNSFETNGSISRLGARTMNPHEGIKAYIEDGSSVWWQRHVANEALSLTDADSDLAHDIMQLLNYGPRETALNEPRRYLHFEETVKNSKEQLAFQQDLRHFLQPNSQQKRNAFARLMNRYNVIGVTFNTVADFGSALTLGALVLGKNPEVWLKGFKDGMREFVRSPERSKTEYVKFMNDPDTKAAIARGAQLYDSTPEALAKDIGGALPDLFYDSKMLKKAGWGRNLLLRFQSSFTQTLNTLRVQGAASDIKLREVQRGTTLTATEKSQIQLAWNKITASPVAAPGQTAEAFGMRLDDFQFAAGFFRAQRQVLYDAFLKGGIEGEIALKAIRNTVAGAMALSFAQNFAFHPENDAVPKWMRSRIDPFDAVSPLDLDALSKGQIRVNPNFLTLSFGSQEIDLGFGMKPLMNLFLGSTVNLAANQGLSEDDQAYSAIINGVKAALKTGSSAIDMKGAPFVRVMNDAILRNGYDFHGNPIHPWAKTPIGEEEPDSALGMNINPLTSLSGGAQMAGSAVARMLPIMAASGLYTAIEETEWKTSDEVGNSWQDLNKDDWAQIGATSALQFSFELFGGKARVSSPKEKLNWLALNNPEAYGSYRPVKYEDLPNFQKRLFEEVYPREVAEYKNFESVKQAPTRQMEGYLAIEAEIAKSKQKIQSLLNQEGLEYSKFEKGQVIYPKRYDIGRERLVEDIRIERSNLYSKMDDLRREYGLLMTPSSDGDRVQNAVREAYDRSTFNERIDFDTLDIYLSRIEQDISDGKFGSDTSMLHAIFEDVAPPNTEIPFVDDMMNYQRTLSNTGWYDFYDEGIKKYGTEYYALFGRDIEPIKTYGNLLREINVLENNLAQIQDNPNANRSVIQDYTYRMAQAEKLKRRVDKYVEDERDDMVSARNLNRTITTKNDIKYTGKDVVDAMVWLGKRDIPSYVDPLTVPWGAKIGD